VSDYSVPRAVNATALPAARGAPTTTYPCTGQSAESGAVLRIAYDLASPYP